MKGFTHIKALVMVMRGGQGKQMSLATPQIVEPDFFTWFFGQTSPALNSCREKERERKRERERERERERKRVRERERE